MARLGDRFRATVGGLPGVFWTLWTGMLVNRLAGFVITYLALYLVKERGFTAEDAGFLVSLYGLGVALAGPVGGTLADRLGRRATMVLSLLTGGLSVAAITVTRDPAALAVLCFFAAATGELYRPAMNAAVADVVAPADRTRAYGLVYWAVNVGWAVGLTVAGLVAERSLTALFYADAGTTMAFALVILLRVRETRPAGLAHEPVVAGMVRTLGDGPFAVFLFLNFLSLVVFTQFQLAVPLDLDAHGVGPGPFAYLMAINGLGVVVLQPTLTPWLRRHDGARLLAAAAALFGLGFGTYALAGLPAVEALGAAAGLSPQGTTIAVFALGGMLWTLGEVLGFPVAAALVADLAPPSLRGRYQGAFSMSWGLAFVASPLVGGWVLHRFGGRTLWLGCLALGLALAAGYLATAEPRRRRLAALASGPGAGGAAAPRVESSSG